MGFFRWLADILEPRIIPPNYELPSPGYWLKSSVIDKIKITKDDLNVLLDEDPKVESSTVADTNSLDTFIDYRHTVTRIAGNNELDHQRILDWCIPGDIVIYEKPDGSGTIIHAIKSINIDSEHGRTWITHGLNPLITENDPFSLTDKNIKWVCVIVAYTDRK